MSPRDPSVFSGACDASAATRVGGAGLFVAASDEDSVLRVYDHNTPGPPVHSCDLTGFLAPEPGEEADLEGAAHVGDLIFWITSHGANKEGVEQQSRQRLFATSVNVSGSAVDLRPVGIAYTNLLRDLRNASALSGLDLDKTAGVPPEAPGGLNIEGLAPLGSTDLLIGFRNPIPRGKAIVARLHNPLALIRGEAEAANLSLAGHLDLGGRGIRAIEFLPEVGLYLLIAGAFDDSRNFRLYAWSGGPDAPVALDAPPLDQLNPEEFIATSTGGGTCELYLFSDDGDAMVGDKKCKKLKDATQRSFRLHTMTVQLPAARTA